VFAVDRHPRAKRDLIDIWLFTYDHWGEGQADRYVRHINDMIVKLATNPGRGSDFGHVRVGLRRFRAGQHRIFYRVRGHRIEIVRILHARMDLQDQFPGNEN